MLDVRLPVDDCSEGLGVIVYQRFTHSVVGQLQCLSNMLDQSIHRLDLQILHANFNDRTKCGCTSREPARSVILDHSPGSLEKGRSLDPGTSKDGLENDMISLVEDIFKLEITAVVSE